jgi:ankyrin repeat protein
MVKNKVRASVAAPTSLPCDALAALVAAVVSDDMEAVLEAAGGVGRPLADVPSGRALGGTLLHCAASPGVVNFLLDEGVPLDGCDAGGNTALHTAAEEGRVGALVHLLISLPDTVHNGRGQLALHAAAAAGQTRAVAALLSKGPGVVDVPAMGATPLQLALSAGHAETAAMLVGR